MDERFFYHEIKLDKKIGKGVDSNGFWIRLEYIDKLTECNKKVTI